MSRDKAKINGKVEELFDLDEDIEEELADRKHNRKINALITVLVVFMLVIVGGATYAVIAIMNADKAAKVETPAEIVLENNIEGVDIVYSVEDGVITFTVLTTADEKVFTIGLYEVLSENQTQCRVMWTVVLNEKYGFTQTESHIVETNTKYILRAK